MCPRSPIKDVVDWDPGILTTALDHDASLPRGHRGKDPCLCSETPGTLGHPMNVICFTAS